MYLIREQYFVPAYVDYEHYMYHKTALAANLRTDLLELIIHICI